jgi:hypothetical protein
MLKDTVSTSIAVLLAAAVAIAQTPSSPQSSSPSQQPSTSSQQPATSQPATPSPSAAAASITLVGCLVREDQVPGRQPNIAERAGVLEDYILTDAQTASETGSASGTAGATGTSGSASATSNISKMYKVEGIPDERLKSLVGKRVAVSGKVDADDRREAAPTGTAGAATPRTADDDMPEFEATSIREVPGSCPAPR